MTSPVSTSRPIPRTRCHRSAPRGLFVHTYTRSCTTVRVVSHTGATTVGFHGRRPLIRRGLVHLLQTQLGSVLPPRTDEHSGMPADKHALEARAALGCAVPAGHGHGHHCWEYRNLRALSSRRCCHPAALSSQSPARHRVLVFALWAARRLPPPLLRLSARRPSPSRAMGC